jgi:AcrR family transcriptional regulator
MVSPGTESVATGRERLSRDRVLKAAIEMADESGLHGVTMRRLARSLGSEAMSLYYYVKSRDALLDEILDTVVGEIGPVAAGSGWKDEIRQIAISANEMLERHPWAAGLMMSPARVRRARMRFMESLLARLRRAGFSAEMTDRAYHVLDSHIIGSAVWETGYSSGSSGLDDYAERFLRAFSEDESPYLAEHVRQHMAIPAAGETTFAFGLDLILDGLERLLAEAAPAEPS